MIRFSGPATGDVWFVYDGDCPLCTKAAQALQIRKAVGTLHLINARENPNHPLMQDINTKGFDLDKGMIIAFQNTYYHGADALHVMALLGTKTGWFNRVNAFLFRSQWLSKLCYPLMRAIRNMALRIKGIAPIHNVDHHSS